MGEGIDDAGTDAEAGKGARTRHKGNLRDIVPSLTIFSELGMNIGKELFGEIVAEILTIFLVV